MMKEDSGVPVAATRKYSKNRKKWKNNVNTICAMPLSGVCN